MEGLILQNKRTKRLKYEERKKIHVLQTRNSRAKNVRTFILATLSIGLLISCYFFFLPPNREKFENPLDTLAYEARAYDEDLSDERLFMPSNDLEEIQEYLNSMPKLTFTPRTLNSLENWHPIGASLIDYETTVVSEVKYKSAESVEFISFFNFAGQLKDIEKSETGEIQDFKYQPYSNDNYNIIVWQDNSTTLAVLIGRPSVEELAQIAYKGSSHHSTP